MRILQVMCALSLAIRGTNPILFASHKWQRGVSSAGFDPSNRRPHRAEAPENPEVSVEQGRLLGRTLVSSKGTKYHAFSGIPYAAPPIGDLRFKVTRVPRTIEPLHGDELPGLWRARPWLLQVVTNILSAGEDCLFVNVYTPQSALGKDAGGGKGLPVLFWIYGGGFVWGEGGRAFYDPDLLIDHGMVVVTFNYRLGPLGFLSLGRGSGVPGNAGVKDQRAALHWVRRNIAAFGGDPDKITVYGESAGAVCTHLHLLSPSTKGLFRGAIMSSGSAAHFWATETAAKAARRARHFAPAVNCKGNLPARELVRCLRNVRPQTLVAFHENAVRPGDRGDRGGRGRLRGAHHHGVPSGDAQRRQASQGAHPHGFQQRGGAHHILCVESLRLADRNITCLVPDDVLPHLSLAEAEEMGHRVRRLYMGHEKPITLANKNDDKFFEMITSFFIYLDTLKLARFLAADPTAAPLYIYRFEYVGALNTFRNLLRIQTKAACHADELNYVWRVNVSPDSRTLKPNATEYKVRDMFSTMLANFVKTGSPTPRGSPLDPRLSWPPFTAMEQAYMSIDKEPRVERNYRRDIIGFWDAIFAERVGGPIWTKIVGMEERRRAVLDTQTNLVHGGHQRIAPKSTR
ncbi:Carboxyl/Cholinesterase 38, partial [Frankliniella occidentalis]